MLSTTEPQSQHGLVCYICDTSLTELRYVLRQEKPTCLPCFEARFADRCELCGKAIGPDFKDLSYKGRHWHEECFRCWACQQPLSTRQFVGKNDGLYCLDCYDSNFAIRCDACNSTFKTGTRKFEDNGKCYHDECFICIHCKGSIGENPFVRRDEGLYCMLCFNEVFSLKCNKCQGILLEGGVTFHDVPYHTQCFLCTHCNTVLSHVKFVTNRDDNAPYCQDCFITLFTKTCKECKQHITGNGGNEKYISFDKDHWHYDCFVCKVCNKSLACQGFLISVGVVVCIECGKQLKNKSQS